MLQFLSGPNIAPDTFVGLVILLLFTGRIVTRKQLQDVREDRDARVREARAESAAWQRAWELERDARRVQSTHIEELLEVGRATSKFLNALPAVSAEKERA
jgi:hypothetical protein